MRMNGRGRGAEGCSGGGRRPADRETPFHSALALDPETVATAEARAPVPGILALILREKCLDSGGVARDGEGTTGD